MREQLAALLLEAREQREPLRPEPRGIGARIVQFLAHGEVTAAEVMCLLATVATCEWLANSTAEMPLATPTASALLTTFPFVWWLGCSLGAIVLAVAAFVTKSKLLRVFNSVLHVGFFMMLTAAILFHSFDLVAGRLFGIFAIGALWSAVRLCARYRE
jgi:hypothetical protein